MSDVPVWSCEFEAAPNQPKLDDLTVGAKFRLNCHGDIAVAWSAEPLRVKFPKAEQAHSLAIIGAEQLNPQSVQLTVTGYRAGEQTPDWVRILQGEGAEQRGFETEKPKWTVKSVMSEGAPKKPYPSFGPWGVSLPTSVWIGLAVLITALVAALIWAVRRTWQRRRVRETLRRHRTALSPAHQFYRDARGLRRRLDEATAPETVRQVADDLSREFRLFLVREFEVPAEEWTDAAIRRDVARRFRAVGAQAGEGLAKTLRELTRLTSRPAALPEDVAQLLTMSLDTVEAIERAQDARPGLRKAWR